MERTARIGIIGGLDRNEARLRRMARGAGRELDFHCGDTRGRGSETLAALVDRCDLVVVITDVNSHGSVQLARRLVKERGSRLLLVRRMGLSGFDRLLEALRVDELRPSQRKVA